MFEVSEKNVLIIFGGILFVALALMGFSLFSKSSQRKSSPIPVDIQKIRTQSQSNEIDSIEKDLMETDLENLDKELQQIELELEEAY